jgi:two-component system sensor histidine kinase AlgZ
MRTSLSRAYPSPWLTLLIGWGPAALANGIAVLTVLGRPRDMVVHVIFLSIYTLVAIPAWLLLHALWRRHAPWRHSVPVLLAATFTLSYTGTAAGLLIASRHHWMPRYTFHWSDVPSSLQGVWFLLMIFCAMYMLVGYYLSAQEPWRRAAAAATLTRDAELRALRYQLHPHFLFNTLNAISTLVVEQRTCDATRMIARLGDFLRATLEGNGTHEVALADELALTEHYLAIEKARLGDRLTVAMQVGPDTLPAAVPYLLLQPLVENAIRHGIAPRREGGQLDIAASRVGDCLYLRLRNDGIPDAVHPASKDDAESASVGLRNVRERLQRLYGNDHRFTLELAEDGGCLVSVDLPFHRADVAAPGYAARFA